MKITLHKMITAAGQEVEYARVIKRIGTTILGQSLMLHRLSLDQLRMARSTSTVRSS